ncbi:MAG: signal peptidase I [Clostridia bacterium]|nr:signal peptidase I [Clostridia bacterium]
MSKKEAKKKNMPKWLDITLRVIEWTLIIFIMVCMLSLLAQRMTGNTPELFGYSTYTVLTDSMAGTYDVGDVVLCKRIKDPLSYMSDTGFKEGDVIAFIAPHNFDIDDRLAGYTVTHRIVTEPYYDEETDTWYVQTRGDAYEIMDRVPIPVENIQGKIVGANKSISKIMQFVSKWYGFVTVIAIPLIAILVWQMAILVKEKSRATLESIETEKQKSLQEIEREHNEKIEELKKKAIEEYLNKKEE